MPQTPPTFELPANRSVSTKYLRTRPLFTPEERKKNYTTAVYYILLAFLFIFGVHFDCIELFFKMFTYEFWIELSAGQLPNFAYGAEMHHACDNLAALDSYWPLISILCGVGLISAQKADSLRYVVTIQGIHSFFYFAYALVLNVFEDTLLGGYTDKYSDRFSNTAIIFLIGSTYVFIRSICIYVKYKKEY